MSLPEVSFADSAWVSLPPPMAQGSGGSTRPRPTASRAASLSALCGRRPCAWAPALQPEPGPCLQRWLSGQDGTPSLPLPQ